MEANRGATGTARTQHLAQELLERAFSCLRGFAQLSQPGGLAEISRGQRPRKPAPELFAPWKGAGGRWQFHSLPRSWLFHRPCRGGGHYLGHPGALPPANFPQPSGLSEFAC